MSAASIDGILLVVVVVVLLHTPALLGQKLANDKADLDTLKFVHALWRHGDRTPSKMIPSDQTNTLDKWKAKFGGLGQLTDDGARQHFNLGRLLRHRYDQFLSCIFTPEQFVYRSSDYNRTKMSAIANLQGLFSPDSQKGPKMPLEENAPKGLEMCFLPQGHDPIVFDDVECPAASKAEDELFSSDGFKKEEKKNAKLLTFLGQKSQYGQVPHPLRRIYYVHDPLNSINAHKKDGFVLPDWVNETMRQEIMRLYNLKNSFNYKVDVIKRLWSGPLFTEILDRMDSIVNGNYKGKEKLHAYSGHDGSIAGLLAILDIYPEVFPTYANALLLELHQPQTRKGSYSRGSRGSASSDGAEPFVRLYHKNTTEGVTLYELQIPNCGPPCTLKKLRETRKAFIIEVPQWKEECEGSKKDKQTAWSSCGSLFSSVKSLGCADGCYVKSESCFMFLGRRYLCC
uniref:Lysosomal acid phosphatase n=1 Tax=Globodera pallida TaxID=36090 RepID=A0A183CGE7_GLOPA